MENVRIGYILLQTYYRYTQYNDFCSCDQIYRIYYIRIYYIYDCTNERAVAN